MGWRWRKSINLGAGTRATMTSRGLGVSWGIAGLRVGKSPTGSLWVSFTVPGTGISFFKYVSSQSSQAPQPSQPPAPASQQISPPQQAANTPLTENQRIVERLRKRKP